MSKIIWYINTGDFPDHQIGYKDNNPRNTRWDNLKAITSSDRTENYRNALEEKPKVQLVSRPVKRATFSNQEVNIAVEEFIKNKTLVNGDYE